MNKIFTSYLEKIEKSLQQIIPTESKIRVLTDRTLNEESLRYMMVVLDVVGKTESNVAEIDLRYGSVSYRRY